MADIKFKYDSTILSLKKTTILIRKLNSAAQKDLQKINLMYRMYQILKMINVDEASFSSSLLKSRKRLET